MNTFSRVIIAMVGMTGLVSAQPKADPKPADSKMAPKPADPKMAPKPADPKMAPKPADSKAADPKAAGGMSETKPPTELAEMAKAAGGTWKCKGQGLDMRSMKMVDMTATMKMKLDLNNWWVRTTFDSRMGKEPFQSESFTTFDPSSKKWKRIMVENNGGWGTGESAGLKDNKVHWEMTTHSPTMGDGMFRDHEDLSDLKAGVKMSGDFSPDKGKTWNTVYEMTCKK
jgi:hypothetical protein